MNNSLYEITREYLEAFDRLEVDEETGEILNFEAVDALAGVFEEKAESVACYIKNLEAFIGSLKTEESSLAERRKSAERKVDNMKKYLTSCLDAAGREKVSARIKKHKLNVNYSKGRCIIKIWRNGSWQHNTQKNSKKMQ